MGHPDTLYSMNGLGMVYTAKKDYYWANYYLSEALKICESKLGYDNPTTLTTLNCFGWLEFNRGKDYYEQAQKYFNDALQGRQMILGYDHPVTLETQYALALLDKAMGKYTQSEQLLRDTLRNRLIKLGPQHPDTIATLQELNNLEEVMGEPYTTINTDPNS